MKKSILIFALLTTLYAQATESLIKNGNIQTKAISAKGWNIQSNQLTAGGTGNILSFDGKHLKLPELDYVFSCGDEGHKSYRIPSIIKTTKGTLLASCEGRVHNAHDAGDINLVMKRSTDHGKTWSKLTMVRDIKQTAGNPCPVVDQETGRIVMVFCEMDHHEAHVMQGKSKRRAFTTYSDDDGLTWSDPVNITKSANPNGDYNWLASGPGVGIQIQQGKHKGRLVIPFAHSIKTQYGVHTIYSDDKGKTWAPSQRIEGGCNESQLVELSDGRLMLNMRMQQNGKGFRGISYSEDGGENWTALTYDDELNDPTCQASIIRYDLNGRPFLIFSNSAIGGRNGMTVKRLERRMIAAKPLREAVINAIIHNDYTLGAPPKFEFFSDRLEITSIGGLPSGLDEEDFFSGLSIPKNKELMRIFRDLDLVEHLGSGIPRILESYSSDIFKLSENFIRITFPYAEGFDGGVIGGSIDLTDRQRVILEFIDINPHISYRALAKELFINESTAKKHIEALKSKGVLERIGGTRGHWNTRMAPD